MFKMGTKYFAMFHSNTKELQLRKINISKALK
jgi:hypothetical protein